MASSLHSSRFRQIVSPVVLEIPIRQIRHRTRTEIVRFVRASNRGSNTAFNAPQLPPAIAAVARRTPAPPTNPPSRFELKTAPPYRESRVHLNSLSHRCPRRRTTHARRIARRDAPRESNTSRACASWMDGSSSPSSGVRINPSRASLLSRSTSFELDLALATRRRVRVRVERGVSCVFAGFSLGFRHRPRPTNFIHPSAHQHRVLARAPSARVFDAPEPRVGRASTSRVVPARVIAYPRARTARDPTPRRPPPPRGRRLGRRRGGGGEAGRGRAGESVSVVGAGDGKQCVVVSADRIPRGVWRALSSPRKTPTRGGKTRTRRFARSFARNTDRGWWY